MLYLFRYKHSPFIEHLLTNPLETKCSNSCRTNTRLYFHMIQLRLRVQVSDVKTVTKMNRKDAVTLNRTWVNRFVRFKLFININ
jgi:hypothetical protein